MLCWRCEQNSVEQRRVTNSAWEYLIMFDGGGDISNGPEGGLEFFNG